MSSTSTVFYNWSGGMESSAMLVVERERIRETGAIVSWADTGKYVDEMYESKKQIEQILGLEIVTVPRRITFDEFLFERGGMVRKGTNDCSRRMKRTNLSRHMRSFPKPWEVNLGYNSEEIKRAEEWIALNERPYCHWRFPLQEAEPPISRYATWDICRAAGFSILVKAYETYGRFDCFFCGNQSATQALKLADNAPGKATEWIAMEKRKGHSFMPIPLKVLIEERDRQGLLFESAKCACFGGTESVWEEEK